MVKKLLLALTLIAVIWWLRLFFLKIEGHLENYLWVVFITFIPFIGAINGLRISRKWGGWKSVIGKSIIFVSLGSLGWSFGDFVWSYYNLFQKIEVPYPSLADLGFFSIVPFWFLGMFFLIKATGGKFVWRSMRGKILLILLPLIGFVISYFMFLKGIDLSHGHFDLKTFLDLAYPLGDTLTITVALIVFGVSARMLGGQMRIPIILLVLGFVAEYFADFSFSYTSSVGTYFNGSWVDFLYLAGQFLVIYGLANFDLKDR